MIELRGRRIAAALALASLTLTVAVTSTVAFAAPMIQGDGPVINGVETAALADTATASNDAQSNTDISQTEARPGAVNETSSTSW